jgi:hypothetical protein
MPPVGFWFCNVTPVYRERAHGECAGDGQNHRGSPNKDRIRQQAGHKTRLLQGNYRRKSTTLLSLDEFG